MIHTRKSVLLLVAFALALVASAATCKTPAGTVVSAQTTDKSVRKLKTPDETEKKFVVLKRPVMSCSDRTASKVYLQWDEVKRASRYHVYRSTEKDGQYEQIVSTGKLTYTDKTVEPGQTYYYKVYAAAISEKGNRILSKFSKTLKVTTKQKVTKTAYVGDSVMSGLSVYQIVQGKGKKVIYKIGVSPYNFYNGEPMDQLLDYDPDRMYIMLGMNSLVGSPTDKQMDGTISSYKKIIQECLKQNPDMQIIVLPVSPTRPSATVHNSNINRFNLKLEKMAESLNVYYYDYTGCLRGSDGALSQSYSGGDGIHLTPSAYRAFKAELDSFGRTLN